MQTVNVEGFHGTSFENVAAIMQDGFQYTRRDDHWLGQGFYFYSEYDLAHWWIIRKRKADDGNGCAVIKAVFNCSRSEWLDLDTVPGVDYFISEVDSILSKESKNVSLKFSATTVEERIKNLCFALDLLKRARGIKLVALTFRKKKPTYAKQSIQDFTTKYFPLPEDIVYQERQICCSRNEIITTKTLVFPTE